MPCDKIQDGGRVEVGLLCFGSRSEIMWLWSKTEVIVLAELKLWVKLFENWIKISWLARTETQLKLKSFPQN